MYMYACRSIRISIYVCVRTYICRYILMHICIYNIYICKRVCLYALINMCM